MTEPFAHTSGPKDAKLVLVGEGWGEQEDLVKLPFVGSSGQELTRMLREAGIRRDECLLTNVLALRPPSNNLDLLCGKKKDIGDDYPYSALRQGLYLLPTYLPEINRLRAELTSFPRNLVVALGNTACWALLNTGAIGRLRGAVTQCSWLSNLKVLPTYHPAAVMRQWAYRPIVIADFIKAKRESQYPELVRPQRQIFVSPDIDTIAIWYDTFASHAKIMSVDIETSSGQIKMIGFSVNKAMALVIPFIDKLKRGWNYWDNERDEQLAWEWVDRLLNLPMPKLFQNGLFDLQYILRMGIRPTHCTEDTMLLHHSIFPEMQKGLGFLGSVYSNEASWKLMRGRKAEELKRDD